MVPIIEMRRSDYRDSSVPQEELLAEAAVTELDNARSLQSILAREEEIKKRQAVATAKFEGVSVRFRSRTVASGPDSIEQVRHCHNWMWSSHNCCRGLGVAQSSVMADVYPEP